jgi:hypothetical protein
MLNDAVVAFLFVLAALALARSLPAQNIVFALGSLAVWELGLECAWSAPNSHWRGWLFWPAMIVLARVAVRWTLRRPRRDWNYGLWLIALAAVATGLAQFVLAPPGFAWGAAARLACIRFASSAFCLFWLSPFLISKFAEQPQERAQ